jgi:uncharacterized protein (DUF427 family)
MRPSGYLTRPDYRVDLLRRSNRVTAHHRGRRLAASDRAILVDEQDHALVCYFPRSDVDVTVLLPIPTHKTHCPFKGDADYWALPESPGQPVAWSYAEPYNEVAALAGHVAFYQDRVDVILGPKAG